LWGRRGELDRTENIIQMMDRLVLIPTKESPEKVSILSMTKKVY
jgi:hypothetical protein